MFTMECKYVLDSESRYQLNTIKDKRMSWKTQPKNMIIFNPRNGYLNKRSITIDTSQSLLDQ